MKQKVLVFKARALAESGFATFTVNAQNADGSLKSEEKLGSSFRLKEAHCARGLRLLN